MKYREQMQDFKEVDVILQASDIEIPELDLTSEIMAKIHLIKHTSRRKTTLSLIQDLVFAAAAAITIFWFGGSATTQFSVPPYTQEVVKVSNSVGSVFQSYIGLYDLAAKSLTHSIEHIDPNIKKGVE